MNKIEERKKMVMAMEYIARQINDENVYMGWLVAGVPDGDIEYGDFNTENIWDEDYMISDKGFKDIMSCFLRRMVGAYNSGGLYCGGIVSETKEDRK